eukprot:8816959-Lingulodinium_polyedra.AAC.1
MPEPSLLSMDEECIAMWRQALQGADRLELGPWAEAAGRNAAMASQGAAAQAGRSYAAWVADKAATKVGLLFKHIKGKDRVEQEASRGVQATSQPKELMELRRQQWADRWGEGGHAGPWRTAMARAKRVAQEENLQPITQDALQGVAKASRPSTGRGAENLGPTD